MIIAIREFNHWENERWTYILNAELQGSAVINDLIIFAKYANEQAKQVRDETMANPNHPFVTRGFGASAGYKLYAASSYIVEFYDSMEMHERGYPILVSGRRKMHFNSFGNGGYKEGMIGLQTLRISPSRMYSARLAMCSKDTPENKLYKNFESLFLKANRKVTA